ncbi:MAG: SMC-Scp complex subunit ScpB [Oligoflexus sp.]|nr:SMC-Scp complex subunit ScpB [Oligoflexus sp.]
MADSNDKFDDETADQKAAVPKAVDEANAELSAQGDKALEETGIANDLPTESELDLDASLIEAAQRWAEEFNPALGTGEDHEDLVLGSADDAKPKGKGKSKKSAKDKVKTQVIEFNEAENKIGGEAFEAEPVDAVELLGVDDEVHAIKEDVEHELLAYGDSLADRVIPDSEILAESDESDITAGENEAVPELSATAEAFAEDLKPKKKGKRGKKDEKEIQRSGASASLGNGDDFEDQSQATAKVSAATESIEPEIVTDDKQGLMRWDEAINLEAQVEAVLFAAPKPISISEIAETLADDDGMEPDHSVIDQIVQQLLRLYKERSGGFRLEYDKGTGYQFRTVPAAAPIMERMFSSRQRPLSRAAHETLAIIAYRQPCTRADIEFIRGVDAGSIIRNLLERDLVACVGRKEDSGRPMLFGTTAEFLRVFRVTSLNDLPPLSAFQPASEAMIDAFNKIERPDHDIDVEDFIGDDSQEQPEISAGLSSDFAKSDGVFEVREDGSESSAPTDAKVRRSGGIFDNEGFLSDGYENTEVALPTRDSIPERSGEDASRGTDQHQRQSGTRTRD